MHHIRLFSCNHHTYLAVVVTVALMLSPFTAAAQSGWESQTSGTTLDLYGVSFADTATGTAVGEGGTILRTTDGGATWTPQNSGLPAWLWDVSFYDSQVGVAVGEIGTILYTKDGGNRWVTAQTGWLIGYYGAHMVSDTLGFTCGQNTIFQPFVTRTQDGWQSFQSFNFYLKQGPVNIEGTLEDIHFVDSTTGFGVAQAWNGQGAVVRSTDGGVTWDTIYWAKSALSAIDFPTPEVGYAVGAKGTILRSTDGGATWEQVNHGVLLGLTDVSFANKYLGTAVGYGGTVLRTTDGGATWQMQDSATGVHLKSVAFPDPHTGYTVGEDGTIIHTAKGGGSPLLADGYTLSATGSATVNFTLDAGPAHAGMNYIILGSVTGTVPGTPLPGWWANLPLNWDTFTGLVYKLTNTAAFTNFSGVLDGSGKATAQLNSLGAIPPGFEGTPLYFAFALYHPFVFTSNAVVVEIVD